MFVFLLLVSQTILLDIVASHSCTATRIPEEDVEGEILSVASN